MGLTNELTKIKYLKDTFDIDKGENQFLIALAGNPNIGKSTVFSYLTGIKQHTDNLTDKAVTTTRGDFKYKDSEYTLINLPGTYSLFELSQEEIVTRNFICLAKPDAVIVVCDATYLERSLNLVFQIIELTDKVILCINLADEANKKGITINIKKIEEELGIPVVLTSGISDDGIDDLLEILYKVSFNEYNFNAKPVLYESNIESVVDSFKSDIQLTINYINPRWLALRLIDEGNSIFNSMRTYIDEDDINSIYKIQKKFPKILDKQKIKNSFTKKNYDYAKKLTDLACHVDSNCNLDNDKKIDNITTSNFLIFPIVLLFLCTILWITIQGANYPSNEIANFLFRLELNLTNFFNYINDPIWLNDMIMGQW